MTSTAQDAATAAQERRDDLITATAGFARKELWFADRFLMGDVDHYAAVECRACLTACLAHLDELTRLIAQRDGMPVSDGPDTGERRYG